MKEENFGRCKLCLEEKLLQKRSHIIPNFMYKSFYHENGMLKYGLLADLKEGVAEELKTGFYESNILCNNCDTVIINKYETYANSVLYTDDQKEKLRPIVTDLNIGGYALKHYKNINYKKFKLFLHTLLWRSSISKLPFFKHVNLGPHENVLRKNILEGDPGDENEYPIVISEYKYTSNIPTDFILIPYKVRVNNVLGYRFACEGKVFDFLVYSKSHAVPSFTQEFSLRKTNEIYIYQLPPDFVKTKLLRELGYRK